MMPEHTILVAVTVEAPTKAEAERLLYQHLPHVKGAVTSWWIAEDDRQDGSDCDSAIFVPRGSQDDLNEHLRMWIDYHRDQWNEEGYPYAETDVAGTWFP
jgi:hypothetical protein